MRAEPLNIDFTAEIIKHQAWRARDRSSGIHLSEILKRLAVRMDEKRYGGTFDPMVAQTGFIWEDLLSEMFGKRFGDRQMEQERDGVIGTMDGFNTERWCPREFKGTKISASNPYTSARYWLWQKQTGGYAFMTGSEEAELYPLHLNGSYELGGGRFGTPVVKPTRLIWTQRELRETWDMVERERDRIIRERKESA